MYCVGTKNIYYYIPLIESWIAEKFCDWPEHVQYSNILIGCHKMNNKCKPADMYAQY